jgi:hypothetical protein
VVVVKVRDQDIIDLADSRLLGDGNNAVGVPPVIPGPAGIDQKRMLAGCDEQSRLSAFDIDEKYA